MYIYRSSVSCGRVAAIFASVCHLTATNHQHTHQHALCRLLAHHNTSSRARLNYLSSSIPVDVVRSLMATGGITDESDGASQLHVICTRHLHHCTVVIVLDPLLSATDACRKHQYLFSGLNCCIWRRRLHLSQKYSHMWHIQAVSQKSEDSDGTMSPLVQ